MAGCPLQVKAAKEKVNKLCNVNIKQIQLK